MADDDGLTQARQGGVNWSAIKKRREEIKKAYPSVFRVPLIYGTKKKIIAGILDGLGGKVLDVGASDRFVGGIIKESGSKIEYRSMDIDSARAHDYYSFDEIKESFDAVFLLDVIEHVPVEEGMELLMSCFGLLSCGGKLVVTIPNNSHPTALGGDCTHVTSYRYHDIGAMSLSAGFEDVRIFRVSAKARLKDRLMALLLRPFMKFFDVDFATGVLLTAKRP